VVGWSQVCGDSYAGTSRPDPWRRAASAVVAPTLSPFFFSNKSLPLIRDSLLLESNLGDKALNQWVYVA
jgi:hypothetical protein